MKYFSIDELTRSTTAQRLNISNIPSVSERKNLEALIDKVLDPLRSAYGHPIIVTSGYRSAELNRAVGGVPGSQHTKGEAADITAGSPIENSQIYNLLRSLEVDQAINEHNFRWIHVSYSRKGCRNQFFELPKSG